MSARTPCIIALVVTLAVAGVGTAAPRPVITVGGPGQACPGVTGTFVGQLDPDRGILLLSGAEAPGLQPAERADGALRIAGASWTIGEVTGIASDAPLWGGVYPFLQRAVAGCVAFSKERFSSEGDLVTYARWLAEEVYASLPADVRTRHPALSLSGRQLVMRVEREGYPTTRLEGREGSTQAFRFHDAERVYLLIPFVLDQATATVAVQLSFTDGDYFSDAEKTSLGWVVVAAGEPARVEEPAMHIAVESIE